MKDQIARDRVDRAAKFGTKSSTAEQPAPAPAAAAPVATTTAPKKEYDSARLQVTMLGRIGLNIFRPKFSKVD